ncbi:MAG: hypothetical protein R3F49_02195 [Planctomycetota bacterium]
MRVAITSRARITLASLALAKGAAVLATLVLATLVPATPVPATLVLGGVVLGSHALAAPPRAQGAEGATFQSALAQARAAFEQGRLPEAERLATRALERDRCAPEAWALRAAVAAKLGDRDLAVYALHTELGLLVAQKASKEVIAARRAALVADDALEADLFSLKARYIADFASLAADYEKAKRPHGAIRAWKQVLALDPESAAATASIERIAALPDPSLAGDAKPVDLFADVSEDWIREHDKQHAEWESAARAERTNYFTVTNAGYEVLIRTAEAMEQMAAFYKVFFRYGTEEDGGSVPRITVHVFKSRDEYLKKGSARPSSGPPATSRAATSSVTSTARAGSRAWSARSSTRPRTSTCRSRQTRSAG